ncbi:hypothetical protein BvCmsC16A_01497 [Escherichia coli]|nr:hypothetical protein BvCmsC16A_01497 [Escherichia coli]
MLGKYKAVLALLLLIILVPLTLLMTLGLWVPRWRASGYRSGHVLH